MLSDLDSAFSQFASAAEPMDTSVQGKEQWDEALRTLEQRVDRAEAQVTARLRDKLGAARSADEMFQVFNRFSALLSRSPC